MIKTSDFPYKQTIQASPDIPDRLIETEAFLSFRRPVSFESGYEGWLRVVAFEEKDCPIAEPETACEIEIVSALEPEAAPEPIKSTQRSEIVEKAASLVQEHFGINRNLIEDTGETEFETFRFYEGTIRFNVIADIMTEIRGWSKKHQEEFASRPDVELMRLP